MAVGNLDVYFDSDRTRMERSIDRFAVSMSTGTARRAIKSSILKLF